MKIIEGKIDDVIIFKLDGRLDSNTSPEFNRKIKEIIKDGTNYIIIDFEKVEYLSSAGLREILNAAKTLKSNAGKLVLCSMSDYIKEIFEVAGFDNIFPIVPAMDDAMKKIKERL
jgi:anti-sigma B factor antagonist